MGLFHLVYRPTRFGSDCNTLLALSYRPDYQMSLDIDGYNVLQVFSWLRPSLPSTTILSFRGWAESLARRKKYLTVFCSSLCSEFEHCRGLLGISSFRLDKLGKSETLCRCNRLALPPKKKLRRCASSRNDYSVGLILTD